MKNREKYRDEIMEAIKRRRADNDNMCRFLRDNVIPRFASEADVEREVCGNLECYTCANLFAFWLDEEYEEPPKPEVDWHNVPVDTLVRVRDGEYEKWRLRYFSGFFEYDSLKYATWNSGRTSKTAEGTDDFTTWRYCGRKTMVVIRTEFKEVPEQCEGCCYYGSRPHPYDGWMDLCELCGERIDGDGCKGDGWYYDGEKRPDNCPLMEVEDE